MTLRLKMYGHAYNDNRMTLGIPVVETGWQSHYSRSNGEVHFSGDKVYGLGHVQKRVEVDYLSGIKRESDLFIFKWVTMDLRYCYTCKEPWEIAYYGRNQHALLSYQQAVDSLKMSCPKMS
ncbi:hypothetical protein LRS06_22265 [Hymenobacter sp. J193]|uniref:hypothetical protein n=1 Tax=Hymenobacter sp. J193 TaxID=2898429 RepID=UPI002150727A|nr:hypothetical protein [Hymenobacter sp. J193]MCR5890299.1 hypothetical protein [Hymenobacter sp. J193]MCR5890456.1 hypothetical protein [Hymenobacter sp. J193]